jgi:hypothetical protein
VRPLALSCWRRSPWWCSRGLPLRPTRRVLARTEEWWCCVVTDPVIGPIAEVGIV